MESQLRLMVSESDGHLDDPDGKASPRCLEKDGSLRFVRPYDWCSGFFPGVLWYMYEYTGNDFWKQKAKVYTERLENVKKYDKIHDLIPSLLSVLRVFRALYCLHYNIKSDIFQGLRKIVQQKSKILPRNVILREN